MNRILLFLTLLFSQKNLPAQPGCTDPQASNFAPGATENDGSCGYPTTYYSPELVANLPTELEECSGVCFAGGRWWAHEDGSNSSFFKINPTTGSILQEVKLKNAQNQDWEDMTTDGTSIFLADLGNNFSGNRTDLGIFKVPLNFIGNSNSTTVQDNEWQFFPINYENQTDFTAVQPAPDSIEFDCEAMIFLDGKFHLFQKNWKKRTTTHFTVEPTGGVAKPIETFDVQGLITSAAISPDQKLVVLLGYNKTSSPNVFAWLLWDFHGGNFFNGNKRRLELGLPLVVGQSEGINFLDNRTGYIVNEKFTFSGVTFVQQQIRKFDFTQFLTGKVETGDPKNGDKLAQIFPNPFSQTVDFQFFGNEKPEFLRVRNELGQVIFSEKYFPEKISTNRWPAGKYFFEIIFPEKTWILHGLKIE